MRQKVDQGFKPGFEACASLLRTSFSAFELNPAFVKAIQHLYARQRVFHSLRPEKSLPGIARHDLHSHRPAQGLRECSGDLVWSYAMRSFQFHHAMAVPRLLQQDGGPFSDVRCRHHWYWLVERLEEARNHPMLTRRRHIPPAVFHKPGRTQKREWNRKLFEHLLYERVLTQQVGAARPRR